jgi:hypothetical protein
MDTILLLALIPEYSVIPTRRYPHFSFVVLARTGILGLLLFETGLGLLYQSRAALQFLSSDQFLNFDIFRIT